MYIYIYITPLNDTRKWCFLNHYLQLRSINLEDWQTRAAGSLQWLAPSILHQIDIDGVMSTHNFFCWNFPGGLASFSHTFRYYGRISLLWAICNLPVICNLPWPWTILHLKIRMHAPFCDRFDHQMLLGGAVVGLQMVITMLKNYKHAPWDIVTIISVTNWE